MTAMSSARPATTPRSWVTRIMAMNRSRCWSCSRSRIWACTVTSSAVVGSSANSSFGPQARAMAIMTRWRMPPDSSCGYWRSRRSASGMPTDCSSARAVSLAAFLPMSVWCSSDSVIWRPIRMTGLRAVMGSWNTMAICAPHMWRISLAPVASSSRPSNLTLPVRVALLGVRPMIERDSTDLPEPDSPTMPSVLPRLTVNDTLLTARTKPRSEVNVVERSSTSSIGASGGGPPFLRRLAFFMFTARSPGRRSGRGSCHRGSSARAR
jgi:hypothetical protein